MSKPARILAKKLLALSFDNGRVSDEKVTAVLQVLRDNPPRNYKTVLESYMAKIRSELRKENARIDFAGSLDEAAITQIKDNLCKYYNRDIQVTVNENPELLAGLRISVADDVWDSSVAGRLQQLAQSF